MALHFLTLPKGVITEIMDYDNTDGEVVSGQWIKVDDSVNPVKYNLAVPYADDEYGKEDACIAYIDSLRSDSGYPHVTNPNHVVTGVVSTITVVRKWDDTLISTDQIDVTGLSVGDQLTVKGGKLVKMANATDMLFGVYLGADPEQMVTNGHIVNLIKQPRFDVVV